MTYDVTHLRHRFNEFHVVISLRHIHMDAASTYDSIGIVYMRLGNFQKAVQGTGISREGSGDQDKVTWNT